jgi:4-hydroxy-tetrahydrodipicolinate synthase
MEIGRLLTAMVTPMDEEGRVDYAQARRLAQALMDSGSDGLVVAGTTGESPTLSHEEKLRLLREVKEAVAGRGTVIVGSATYRTEESIELSREAERAGADGLLLVTPYYHRPTQEGLYRHFRAIAEAVAIPCILYNVPSRTGVNLAAETALRLSQVPNIVGVKEAGGDLGQAARIIEGAPPGFRVWSGDDAFTLPLLAIGGYGVIAVVSHLAGRQFKRMIEAFLAGAVEEAARLHRRLLPLMQTLMTAAPNPIPVKYALNQVGFRVGRPRLPLTEPDPEAAQRIMAEVARVPLDLQVPV